MSHRRFAARPSTAILSSALVLLATAGCTPATVATALQSPAASAPAGADLAQFFDNYDEAQLSLSPQSKAYRGIRDADYGKWNDPSDDAEVASHTLQQATAAAMRASFDPTKLSAEEALSFELFNAQAARAERLFPFRDDEYIFDQMNGAQSQMPAFLINIHRVANVAEAEAYVERIRGMGPVLDALSAESARRAKKGVQPPKWVYAYVISDIENLMKPDNAVIEDIGAKVGKLDIDAGGGFVQDQQFRVQRQGTADGQLLLLAAGQSAAAAVAHFMEYRELLVDAIRDFPAAIRTGLQAGFQVLLHGE